MTTLYRPVLIESAEQAEALPIGTMATYWDGPRLRDHALKTDSILGPWEKDMRGYRHGVVVGWTALVPIEAEEEWALIYDGQEPTPCADEADAREWARIDGEGQAPSRRYTTTWEETP